MYPVWIITIFIILIFSTMSLLSLLGDQESRSER